MTDDQLHLASAYLDGDVDAGERAAAEGDPDVMAEVARLRAAGDALRATEPPDPARRERAIAAALAAATTTPAAPATVVPLRRRRAWWSAGAVAAAVVALVVGGVVIARNGSSGDGDDAAVSASTALSRADAEAAAPAGGAAPSTAGAGAAADTYAGTAAPEAAAPATPALPVLESPADVATFAASSSRLQQATAADADTCHAGQFVGRASYGSPPTTVEVYVIGHDAVALDAATCDEVARAPMG